MAKIDGTEEKELVEEFEIAGFPFLKLFINGDRKKPVDYTGKDAHNKLLSVQLFSRSVGKVNGNLSLVVDLQPLNHPKGISHVLALFKDN